MSYLILFEVEQKNVIYSWGIKRKKFLFIKKRTKGYDGQGNGGIRV